MADVTTTLVVTLSSSSGAAGSSSSIFKAEIDSRDEASGGLNNGQTSFAPGDSVGYLLYQSSDVLSGSVTHTPNIGGVNSQGGGSRVVEEFVTFTDNLEVNLNYPLSGGITSQQWFGTNLGNVAVVNDRTVSIGTVGVGVVKLTYTTSFSGHVLSGTLIAGEDNYPVTVFITGATA